MVTAAAPCTVRRRTGACGRPAPSPGPGDRMALAPAVSSQARPAATGLRPRRPRRPSRPVPRPHHRRLRGLPGRQPVEHPHRPPAGGRGPRRGSSPGRPPGAKIHLDLGSTEEYYGIPVNVVPQDQAAAAPAVRRRGRELRRRERPRAACRSGPSGAHRGRQHARARTPASGDRHVITVQRGTLRADRALQGQAGHERPGPGRRLARLVGGALEARLQRAAPEGLDLGRRRRAADPARAARLRRGRERPRSPTRSGSPCRSRATPTPARPGTAAPPAARRLPAYGMRFRLKASFPARRYTGAAHAIVVAMKRYGLMYADQGSRDVRHRHLRPALGRRARPVPRPARSTARGSRWSSPARSPSAADRAVPELEGQPSQGVAHGHELRLRLGELGLGIGVGDDAAAGEESHRAARRARADRRAMPHSPSPAASIQPTGPA